MKVLQIAYSSGVAGGEMMLLEISRTLLRQGHEVHVLIPGPGPIETPLAEMGAGTILDRPRKTYDLRGSLAIRGAIRKTGAQVVHSHGMLVNILTRLGGRAAKVAAIVNTAHITLRLWRRGRTPSEEFMRLYYRSLDNFTAPLADRIIAVSEAVRLDQMRQGIPEHKLRTILNGVDNGRYSKGIRDNGLRARCGAGPGEILVGMAGRISPQKGVDVLLRAARLAIERNQRVRFAFAGDGMLRREMENLRDSLGLEGAFHFLGPYPDVSNFLASIDIFCLSSNWEGLPLVVLEAMSAGLPVVATSADGTVEAVVHGKTGFLTRIGDASAIAGHLLAIAADGELARELGNSGRKRAFEAFTLDRMAAETIALYEELLSEKGALPARFPGQPQSSGISEQKS